MSIRWLEFDAYGENLAAIASDGQLALEAHNHLLAQLCDGERLVACWVKPTFHNELESAVFSYEWFVMMVTQIVKNYCKHLRFYATTDPVDPWRDNRTISELFEY